MLLLLLLPSSAAAFTETRKHCLVNPWLLLLVGRGCWWGEENADLAGVEEKESLLAAVALLLLFGLLQLNPLHLAQIMTCVFWGVG